MTKLGKYERIIYVFILILFLFSGFFPICVPVRKSLDTTIEVSSYYSYYSCLFNYFSSYSSIPEILLQALLFIPFVSVIIALICLFVELGQKANNDSASHCFGVCVIMFEISGMLYATLTNSLFPFGMTILAIGLGIGIVKIIFHFGLRALRI